MVRCVCWVMLCSVFLRSEAPSTLPWRRVSSLALLWLFPGLMAYLAIRRRDIERHRRWMIRNFSLTFAAVTLRIYIPLSFVAGVPFEDSYPLIAWLCWVPNLLVAEWVIKNRRRRLSGLCRCSVPATTPPFRGARFLPIARVESAGDLRKAK